MIYTIFIGAIAGWLSCIIMKRDSGILTNTFVGIIGGMLGHFVFDLLNIETTGAYLGPIIMGTVGSVLFLLILGKLRLR